tara:strand:- start:2738 stop:3037 length:300 start_codon:yes stop_codon:yes gene_type:complete
MSAMEGWMMDGAFAKMIHAKTKGTLEVKSREMIFMSNYFHENEYYNTEKNELIELMKYKHLTPLNEEEMKSYEKVYNTLKRKTTINNKVKQIATELGWR